MRYLLILLILLTSLPAKADAPVIWFGLWAKSLTSNGLEARGLKLDKNATASTPWTLVIPSPALVTSWTMTLPLDAGTANYVLKSDGTGVTAWSNPATLIAGSPNTFAGFDSSSVLSSIPGWSWINATGGANVQLNPVPTTGEGTVNLHTFGSSLNPASNVTGSTWIQNQSEINVGSDDSGNTFSADGSGGVIGLQVNVNSRNKSDVGQISGISQNTQIGNGTDAVSSNNYQGITSNFSVSDNADAQNQNYAFSSQFSLGTGGSTNNFTTLQGNMNSTGTTAELRGISVGGNANDVSSYFLGYSSNYNFNNVQNFQGFASNSNIAGTVTNNYSGFSAGGNVATTNGVTVFADFLNLTNNATNGYTSYNATPTIGTTNSYIGLNVQPNMSTINNYVSIIDTGGTASVTVPNWTDINIHPNLPLVTDGYKGINITPTAVGDGSGYATVGYFDASNLTNFSTGQVLAIQTQGNAQINGFLNAFAGITPVDQGGNPNAVHSLVSGVTTAANTTTANVDTIGVNTASLMTISTNSINTSGPFGLGLAALALPAVLKTETGSSIDHVNAAVFATSLDPTSTGGTVDELVGGRFTVIPQGGTHTINTLKLVKADLPFGDPATKSWGFYGSSTTSENWFAKNIKIGGTAGSTDFVSDASSVLQVEGGSIDVLNGQIKTSTANSNIYVTPNGSGCTVSQIPDSTSAGGNARGTYCVDLQTFRNNADEVASANVSVVIGAANKASAEFSMALGGVSNYATADKSVILGGADNTAAHNGAYVFGTGGLSQTAGDFIFSSGSAPSSEANNYFRLAGDTHSVHVGVYDDTGANGFENGLLLHGRDPGTQSKYIGLKAPDAVTTSTTFTLPDGDGTSGQVLQTNGSAVLSWASVPGGNLTVTAVATTYSILTTDQYLSCTGGASYTVTLPTASGVTGKTYIVKSLLTAPFVLTLATTGGETIDGATTKLLDRYDSLSVISNGTNWEIF